MLIFEFLQYVLRVCTLAGRETPTGLPSLLAHLWLNTQFMANFFLYSVGNRRFRAALRCRRRIVENSVAAMNNASSRTLELRHKVSQQQPLIVITNVYCENQVVIENQV